MPTLIATPEPEVVDDLELTGPCACELMPVHDSFAPVTPPHAHPLFADSLLESTSTERRRRGLTTSVSVVLQCTA